jgi:DNA-binding response OmpR family regulator
VQQRLLVVDDDPDAAGTTATMLRRAGYEVATADSGAAAVETAKRLQPDLMVLDLDLPDMDGDEVLEALKSGTERLPFPVLILTGARPAPGDQVLGLERGATDYVLKGVDRQVLLARVRRALREASGDADRLRRGELLIDAREGRAFSGERSLNLERKPLHVLYQLALHDGSVVTRDELLRRVWGTGFKGFEHSVEQAVYAIRKELGEGCIETVHGVGYRFRGVG